MAQPPEGEIGKGQGVREGQTVRQTWRRGQCPAASAMHACKLSSTSSSPVESLQMSGQWLILSLTLVCVCVCVCSSMLISEASLPAHVSCLWSNQQPQKQESCRWSGMAWSRQPSRQTSRHICFMHPGMHISICACTCMHTFIRCALIQSAGGHKLSGKGSLWAMQPILQSPFFVPFRFRSFPSSTFGTCFPTFSTSSSCCSPWFATTQKPKPISSVWNIVAHRLPNLLKWGVHPVHRHIVIHTYMLPGYYELCLPCLLTLLCYRHKHWCMGRDDGWRNLTSCMHAHHLKICPK